MPRVTLSRVARKAATDRRFFRALVRNPDAALATAKWQLSEADKKTLHLALKGNPVHFVVDARKLLRKMHGHPFWLWMLWPWMFKAKRGPVGRRMRRPAARRMRRRAGRRMRRPR